MFSDISRRIKQYRTIEIFVYVCVCVLQLFKNNNKSLLCCMVFFGLTNQWDEESKMHKENKFYPSNKFVQSNMKGNMDVNAHITYYSWLQLFLWLSHILILTGLVHAPILFFFSTIFYFFPPKAKTSMDFLHSLYQTPLPQAIPVLFSIPWILAQWLQRLRVMNTVTLWNLRWAQENLLC